MDGVPRTMEKRPGPAPRREGDRFGPNVLFFSAWGVVGIAVVIALLTLPAAPVALGGNSSLSYVGSSIPPGTNFTFIFSEAIAIFQENLTGAPGSPSVTVLVSGNWTASAPTWVRLHSGTPGDPSCFALLGCEYGPGNLTGPFRLTAQMPTNLESMPGVASLKLYLEFWTQGSDTVTVLSTIGASVVP